MYFRNGTKVKVIHHKDQKYVGRVGYAYLLGFSNPSGQVPAKPSVANYRVILRQGQMPTTDDMVTILCNECDLKAIN